MHCSCTGLELSGGWGWTPQFMSTGTHFWVKMCFKFQSLGKISNISAADPPVLLGQFQHCSCTHMSTVGARVNFRSHWKPIKSRIFRTLYITHTCFRRRSNDVVETFRTTYRSNLSWLCSLLAYFISIQNIDKHVKRLLGLCGFKVRRPIHPLDGSGK